MDDRERAIARNKKQQRPISLGENEKLLAATKVKMRDSEKKK